MPEWSPFRSKCLPIQFYLRPLWIIRSKVNDYIVIFIIKLKSKLLDNKKNTCLVLLVCLVVAESTPLIKSLMGKLKMKMKFKLKIESKNCIVLLHSSLLFYRWNFFKIIWFSLGTARVSNSNCRLRWCWQDYNSLQTAGNWY